MKDIVIRRVELQDLPQLAQMRHSLWPDASTTDHAHELTFFLSGESPAPLPTVVLVAQGPNRTLIGFIEAGLRSHADGCDPAHPVGFVEGWYVAPQVRRESVGTKLMIAAEMWARDQGCLEMASDTWLDALESQRAHEALGFDVVDRCVHYRKRL